MTTKIITKSATLDTSELRKALQKIGCLKIKGKLPVLSTVKAEFANGKAVLTTNDLEKEVRIETAAVGDEFSALLRRKTTEKFLTGANGEVTITQSSPTKISLSRDGTGDLSLTVPPIDNFPPHPLIPDNLNWHSIDGKWFCSMLKIASTACATEESRPVLTGVACNDGRIAAADGFRLVALQDSRLTFGLEEKQAIIPLKTISLINKLFRKAETLEIAFDIPKYLVYVKANGISLVSQLITGTYPDLLQLIPNNFSCKVSFSAPLMTQRLSMIDEKAIDSGIVRSIFESQKTGEQICSLSTKSVEGTEYHMTCPVKFEGIPARIAFNYKYITDAIKPFSVCNMELTSPSSPCKFTGDIEGLTIVVMPMFVQWEKEESC